MVERGAPGQLVEACAVAERRLGQQRQAGDGADEGRGVEQPLGVGRDRAVLDRVAQAERQRRRLADRERPLGISGVGRCLSARRTGSVRCGRRSAPNRCRRSATWSDRSARRGRYNKGRPPSGSREASPDCSWNSWLNWSCSASGTAADRNCGPVSRSRLQRACIRRSARQAHEGQAPDLDVGPERDAAIAEAEAVRRVVVAVLKAGRARLADRDVAGRRRQRPILVEVLIVPGAASASAPPPAARSTCCAPPGCGRPRPRRTTGEEVRPVAAVARQADREIARDPIAPSGQIGVAAQIAVGAGVELALRPTSPPSGHA